MKKLMMMVVAAMMATVNVNAQVENLRHEIGVTYGTGVSVFGDGLGEGLGRAIVNGMFGMGKVGTETYDEKDFGLYSKAAIGATFVNAKVNKTNDGKNESNTENKTYFAYQASFIGVEGGIPNLRAFVEGGFGEQGVIALGGVRVKF